MIRLRPDSRRASLPFFITAVAAVFPIAACSKKQERPPRPIPTVAVVPVRRASVPYMIEANGVVTPMQTVSVLSQVDGIVQSVDFEEGQDVAAGQALFHIDPRPYQNAYEQSLAILARDSANAANASSERDRYQKLLSAKVITPQEAAAQFTTSATTDATVRADRANLATAKFNLENTVIRAPIGGKTGSLLVRKGNLVRAGGAQPLVVINQVRPIYVRFAIPSSQLTLLLQYGSRGGLPVTAVPGGIAPASPSIDSLASETMAGGGDASNSGLRDGGGAGAGAGAGASASAPSPGGSGSGFAAGAGGGDGGMRRDREVAQTGGPNADGSGRRGGRRGGGGGGMGSRGGNGMGGGAGGQTMPVAQAGLPTSDRLTGRLSFIDNMVDTSTGTVQLKATFDNASGRLWAGQFAATSLHLFDEDSVLVVPSQAVVTGQRGTYVYVVDQSDTARQRAVVVERAAGGLSILSSGVHEGDRVVTDGQARLTPDSPVRLRGAGDDAAGGAGGGRRGGKKRGGGGGGGAGNGGPGRGASADGGATSGAGNQAPSGKRE